MKLSLVLVLTGLVFVFGSLEMQLRDKVNKIKGEFFDINDELNEIEDLSDEERIVLNGEPGVSVPDGALAGCYSFTADQTLAQSCNLAGPFGVSTDVAPTPTATPAPTSAPFGHPLTKSLYDILVTLRTRIIDHIKLLGRVARRNRNRRRRLYRASLNRLKMTLKMSEAGIIKYKCAASVEECCGCNSDENNNCDSCLSAELPATTAAPETTEAPPTEATEATVATTTPEPQVGKLGDCYLTLTSDEETSSDGTIKMTAVRDSVTKKLGCSCENIFHQNTYECDDDQSFCVRVVARKIGDNRYTAIRATLKQKGNPPEANKNWENKEIGTGWTRLSWQVTSQLCDETEVTIEASAVAGNTLHITEAEILPGTCSAPVETPDSS